MKWRKDKL